MMNIKKITAAGISAVMVLGTLSGCGNGAAGNADDTNGTALGTTQTQASVSADSSGGGEGETFAEDMADINIMYIHTGGVTKYDDVEAALNELTEVKINVHVNMEVIGISDYIQQLNLKISSKEKLDALVTIPAGTARFVSMTSQNQLMPIDDLLAEYGQGILETVPEIYLKAGKVDGIQYAVPCYADKVDTFYWFVRQDLVDKYNIDIESMDSLEDIEEALAILAENEPSMSALVPSMEANMLTKSTMFVTGDFSDTIPYDPILDQQVIIQFEEDPDTIVNYYDTDGFREVCEIMHRWYEAGYIYKDSATNMDAGESLIKNGKGASYFSGSDGQFASINSSCGYEMAAVPIFTVPTCTSSFTNWTWAIPVTATEPEAAMKFINLLFTDEDVINLMNFGIEGVHWEEKPDGTIGFPEGVDSSNSGYYLNATWIFGNQFLSRVWEGNDPDSRQIALEKQENALYSPAIGFTVDTSLFENELTSINNIIEEYRNGLISGVLDPETELPAFLEKLENGGMPEILQSCQQQYDEWKAQNQ